MSAWLRFGYGLFSTLVLMVGGLLYNRVFVDNLMPLIDMNGTFSQSISWLDTLVPIILAGLLLFTWAWVVAGAVREERTVDRRRRIQ